MEGKWWKLPSVLWSAYLLDCIPAEIFALRLVDRRTKIVIEKALDQYLSLLRQKLARSKTLERIEVVRRQVGVHRTQAQALLLQVQGSGLHTLLLREPSPVLQEVALFLYRLGHPNEEQSKGWPEARWQLANLPLFLSQLTDFDGRLREEAADLIARLTETVREREVKLLLAFVREYSAAAALITSEFIVAEQRNKAEMRLFACVSKICSLRGQD